MDRLPRKRENSRRQTAPNRQGKSAKGFGIIYESSRFGSIGRKFILVLRPSTPMGWTPLYPADRLFSKRMRSPRFGRSAEGESAPV